MPYLSIGEALSATSKIAWCWTDDNGQQLDMQRFSMDLAAVEAEINTSLYSRYAIPIDPLLYPDAVALLKGFAAALLKLKGYAHHPAGEIPVVVATEGATARAHLIAYRNNTMDLLGVPQRTNTGRAKELANQGDDPVYTRRQLGGWG